MLHRCKASAIFDAVNGPHVIEIEQSRGSSQIAQKIGIRERLLKLLLAYPVVVSSGPTRKILMFYNIIQLALICFCK